MGQSGLRNWGSASQRWAWSLGDLGFHLALFINISVSSLKFPNLSEPQLPPQPHRGKQRASLPAHLSENWGKAGFALPWPWGGALFQEGKGCLGHPVVWLVPVLSKCPPSRSRRGPSHRRPAGCRACSRASRSGLRAGARPNRTICLNGNAAQVSVWSTGNC